jgi:hypothetical protein
VVKLLINDRRCDVNSRDKYGDTPLHKACRCAVLSIVVVSSFYTIAIVHVR